MRVALVSIFAHTQNKLFYCLDGSFQGALIQSTLPKFLLIMFSLNHYNSLIIVDSTRRGKRFPDALSKTIPIWCAVLNRARISLLPPNDKNSDATLSDWNLHGGLWTLPTAVGRSEHAQIDSMIEAWCKRLCVCESIIPQLLCSTLTFCDPAILLRLGRTPPYAQATSTNIRVSRISIEP
jgi:hypothetical protein